MWAQSLSAIPIYFSDQVIGTRRYFCPSINTYILFEELLLNNQDGFRNKILFRSHIRFINGEVLRSYIQ